MKTKNSRKSAFTLVEIMIVVAIIGLLAAIAVPNFVKARTSAQQNACLNNLRQIDGAIQQWALESKAGTSQNVQCADITPYLKSGSTVTCPAGGTANSTIDLCYATTTVDSRPTCKIQPMGYGGNYPHALP